MKLIVKAAAIGIAVLALGACNNKGHTDAAENVTSNADAMADNIVAAADNKADNITSAAHNKADAIRAAGENKAEMIDNSAKADKNGATTTTTNTTHTETKKK